jgi:hypothetical protein
MGHLKVFIARLGPSPADGVLVYTPQCGQAAEGGSGLEPRVAACQKCSTPGDGVSDRLDL